MFSNHAHSGRMGAPRFAGCIWLAAALAPACATSPAAQDGDTGQLVLPLLQAGSHGELFRLSNAIFDITDVNGAATTLDGSGNQTELDVDLPPGIASVTLRDGWRLEESLDGGSNYVPVDALLGTPSTASLRVLANQPAIVEFGFLIRQTTGTLEVTLGVVPDPRELAGGLVVSSATGAFASYALPGNTQLDFAIYFQLARLQSVTLADGTKQHIYTAGIVNGVPGPNPPLDTALAMELYNDRVGSLASALSNPFGSSLSYTVSAKPDGTFELSGQFSNDAVLTFGPSQIDPVSSPSLDADGFPADGFFYDSGSPFTLTSGTGDGTISGTLRIRHLVPSP